MEWKATAIADTYIASASDWNTAHGWGNHASAGYLTSSSSAQWSASSGNVYRSTGNVGIGTNDPSDKLHVKSASNVIVDIDYSNISENEMFIFEYLICFGLKFLQCQFSIVSCPQAF